MDIDKLKLRSQTLAQSIETQTQGVFILRGHKQEVDFQITELEKQAEAVMDIANPEALPVE